MGPTPPRASHAPGGIAKRMKARTIELDARRLGIISHPREIADLILEAAGHAA
jgi:hypothetical protein